MPTTFDFLSDTEADEPQFDFTEDVDPKQIKASPYEQYRIEHPISAPMGIFGPAAPEEVLSLPQIAKIPAAAIEATGIPETVSDISADFFRRTGIDPSAQPGKPMVNIPSYPITAGGPLGWALRKASPETARGVDEAAGQLLSGFTEPGMATTLPFAGLKPVAAGFGAQIAASIPESIQAVAEAKTPYERGIAGTHLAAGLSMGAGIAHGLTRGPGRVLPRAAIEAARLAEERKVSDASRYQEATEVHGPMRPQPIEGAGEVPTEIRSTGVQSRTQGLEEEAQVLLTKSLENNKALGLGNQLEIVDNFGPTDPGHIAVFKSDGAIVDADGNFLRPGMIRMSRTAFDLTRSKMPKPQFERGIESSIAEEGIHSITTPEEALAYHNSLTAAERALGERLYRGPVGPDKLTLNPELLGHELLRQRMQRLLNMEPTEIAEVIGRERWSRRSLEIIAGLMRRFREWIGTEAAKTGKGIAKGLLDRAEQNTKLAIDAIPYDEGISAENAPFAIRRNIEVEREDGTRFPATFDGYYDFRSAGLGLKPAISFPLGDGSMTSGLLPKGAKMIGEVPTFEEWLQRKADLKPEPGYVRLYHGEGGAESAGVSGAWWTDNPQYAATFGEKVSYVDVPSQVALNARYEARRQGTGGPHFILPERYSKQAKPMETPPGQKVYEVGPAAIRRKLEDKTPELLLPPVKPGEVVERSAFPVPKATEINRFADEHFATATQSGELPDFKSFKGLLESKYGAGVTHDAVYWPYMEALTKWVMNAKGTQVEALMDKLGLRGQVATALKPGEAAPKLGRGRIPDPMALPALQMEMGELVKNFTRRKRKTLKAWEERFGPEQKRRYAAIGAVIDELAKDAGKKPEKPWNRTDIGPEDIAQKYSVVEAGQKIEGKPGEELPEDYVPGQVESRPSFTTIPPQLQKNAVELGKLFTKNAAVDATGKEALPRTVSKNLVALSDKSGRVFLVSTWKDPRSGPKVTNPLVPTGFGRKVDAALLDDYTPIAVMTLRDPVQGYRRLFGSQSEFDKYFGDIGIEGTPGLKTSSFAGPEAGAINAQAGIRSGGKPPVEEPGLPPSLTEVEKPSETLTELTTPQRKPIRAGTPLYRMPRPQPEPAEKLPLGSKQFVEARAAEQFPAGTGLIVEPEYGKPTGRIVEYGKPEKMGVGFPLRVGIAGTVTGRRVPASLARIKAAKQQAQDTWTRAKGIMAASYKRRETKRNIAQTLDAYTNSAELHAGAAGEEVRLSSGEALTKPFRPVSDFLTDPVSYILDTGKTVKEFRQKRTEALMRRKAAVVIIASGTKDPQTGAWKSNYQFIPRFRNLLAVADNQVARMKLSIDPRKQMVARAYEKKVKELREALEYAAINWRNPQVTATVEAVRRELKEEIDFENANGGSVTERENYVPGRYEADFWNDNAISWGQGRLLGTVFRKQKSFPNYFAAISAGPYLPATLDAAALVEHRVSQGRRIVMNRMWLDSLKSVYDEVSHEPVAMDPKWHQTTVMHKDPDTGLMVPVLEVKYSPPSIDYPLVRVTEGGSPTAVRSSYKKLIQTLTEPSQMDRMPLGPEAKFVASALKHGVLLIADTFHLARLTEYAFALLGGRSGFNGGYSAIHYRPNQLDAAVAQGFISKASADWAKAPVTLYDLRGNPFQTTRQNLANELVTQHGLNAAKLSDAMYKDIVRQVPVIGESWWKAISPYNHWLFDKFVPGLIVETAVRHVEKYSKEHPRYPVYKIMRDVARDTNIFYGSLGRQGFLKHKTFRDWAQVVLLAPNWVESLIQKEIRFYSRATGLSYLMGRRKGPYMGTLGSGMGKGLLGFLALTQIINLITRGKPTFMNDEKGHQLDAWIPTGEDEGYWISPMAVFSEVIHDIIRLSETKPKAWDAITQIGSNKLGPVGKMMAILKSGESPMGEKYSTTRGVLWGATKQLLPTPIAFGTPTRAIAHAVAPESVSPPRRGAVGQQALASLAGLKVQPGTTALQEIGRKASAWMDENNLRDDSLTWQPTDQASYSKLRAAIRNDDTSGARAILKDLRKKKSDTQIFSAMETWARKKLTGSDKNETLFLMSLNEGERELYNKAMLQKMQDLLKFQSFIMEDLQER